MGSFISRGVSSEPSSAPAYSSVRKIGLVNTHMTGGEDVKRLLECPICMEIFDSPIYLCQTGHTICNGCKLKLEKCPSCEAPFGTTRSFALESLLQAVSFFCNHLHKGCKQLSKIQDLQRHHETCEYRPLKCHLSDKDDCNGTMLYLADTLGHLQDTHKLVTVKSKTGQPNVFTSNDRISFADSYDLSTRSKIARVYMWEGELFHFDDNVFVSLMRSEGLLNYFGFYIIGPKADASKYSVKISVQKETVENTIFKNEVTTQFTSIRDFQEEWEDWKLPDEAIVHDKVLYRDKIIPNGLTVEARPKWGVTYTINKI